MREQIEVECACSPVPDEAREGAGPSATASLHEAPPDRYVLPSGTAKERLDSLSLTDHGRWTYGETGRKLTMWFGRSYRHDIRTERPSGSSPTTIRYSRPSNVEVLEISALFRSFSGIPSSPQVRLARSPRVTSSSRMGMYTLLHSATTTTVSLRHTCRLICSYRSSIRPSIST